MKRPREFTTAQAVFAEVFGTFLLTFVEVCTAVVDKSGMEKLGILGTSLGAVAAVSTVIFIAGEVSGAHINPAVTLAFALRRDFPWRRVPLYWIAQIAGALLAATLALALFGARMSLGVNEPLTPSPGLAWSMELILSGFLITVILASSNSGQLKGWRAALPVGATLLFCGLVGRGISGASMNPARSLAPALIAGKMEFVWLYVSAPLTGAVAGVICVFLLRGAPTGKEVEEAQGK